MKLIVVGYLVVVAVASLLAFVAYGIDKRQATGGGRRIPERVLQQLALLGGWPGAWLGQRVFRHKTHKRGFQLQFKAIVAVHVGLIVVAVYYWCRL